MVIGEKNLIENSQTISGLNSKDKTLDSYANIEYNGDTKQLAQAINNMFVSVSKDLQPLLPMIYPKSEELPSDLIIYVEDVEKQLMYTHLHKAFGPNQLPNGVLKDMVGIIAAPMCHLFNSSLRDSYIPTIWKSANICPLPKIKPIQDISKDLQPISLNPVLKQYPVNHMRETCQNVDDSSQFGAVKAVQQPLDFWKSYIRSTKQLMITKMERYMLWIGCSRPVKDGQENAIKSFKQIIRNLKISFIHL